MELEQIAVRHEFLHYAGILAVDLATNTVQISLGDVTLNYGERYLYENPTTKFLDEAVTLHFRYLDYLDRHKKAIFEKLGMYDAWISDANEVSQSIISIVVATIDLVCRTFKTPRGTLREISSEIESQIEHYEDCEKVIKYGRSMMQDILSRNSFDEDIRERFDILIKLCVNIMFMYSDLIERLKRAKQFTNEVYAKLLV